MAYGPHTRRGPRPGCSRRWASTRSRRLFEDIPAAVRATGSTSRRPSPSWCSAPLTSLAARNRVDLASFLGAGVYRHHLPATVDAILSRGEFATAYTPYQPEISQGTLQTIYEYQSLIAELTGLPVVSASHYDGAAATAEAALMTIRATGRDRVLVSRAVHRHYLETTRTYFAEGGRSLEELPTLPDGTTDLAALEAALADGERPVAGVLLGQPNAFGILEPMAARRRPRACRRRPLRRGRRAGLARRARVAGRVRRGHRGRRGPAAGHRAPVRWPLPGHPRGHARRSSARSRAASSGGRSTSMVGART